MSVIDISVAQLQTYEADPSQNAAPSGSSYTVVDTAAQLESLSQSDINNMPSIGATAIAASDTPAVMSANQITWLVNNSIAITVPPNITPQNSNDGITDLPNPNGVTIDMTWDPSVASAPADFEATIEQGAEILEQTILGPFTFNIDVGYAEVGGGVNSGVGVEALPGNTSAANISFLQDYNLTYSQLLTDLTEGESSQNATSNAQATSVNDLPNTTSLDGQTNFYIGSAEAKALTADDPALNLISPTASPVDGAAGFSNVGFSGSELVGAVLHEFTHAMGRVPGTTALSLFQYLSSSAGNPQHDFNNGSPSSANPAPASYFSIDGGVTTLAQFGQTSDESDFLNSPASTLTPNDPFDEGVAGSELTPQDLVMLNVLGFQINPVESFSSGYVDLLTSNEINMLASVGITSIEATGGTVELTPSQVDALQSASITVTDPGYAVVYTDIAQDIDNLTSGQIAVLQEVGVTSIDATGFPVEFSLDQALALGAASIYVYDDPVYNSVAVTDLTPGEIEGLTSAQIAELHAAGVTTLVGNSGPVELDLTEAEALVAASIYVSDPPYGVVCNADWNSISAFTSADVADLKAAGVTSIASNGSVILSADAALALIENIPLPVTVPPGDTVTISDSPTAIASMLDTLSSGGQVSAVQTIGVSAISCSGLLTLSLAEAEALEVIATTGVAIETLNVVGAISILDTAENIEKLTINQCEQIGGLFGYVPTLWPGILSSDSPITIHIAQAVTLANARIVVAGEYGSGSVTISDTAADIESLTMGQLEAMVAYSPAITATDASVQLTVATVDNLYNTEHFHVVPPPGGTVVIIDTAAAIDIMQPVVIADLRNLGVTAVTASDGSLTLNIDQAVAFFQASIAIHVPSGDTVTVADTAANIEALTEVQTFTLYDAGYSSITATDGPVALSVALAKALLENPKVIEVVPPAGDRVSLSDSAADIATMTAEQLNALASINVTAVTVTDPNLDVTDAKALELAYAAAMNSGTPITPTAPGGGGLTLSDTAADIATMTAVQLNALASINVTAVTVTDPNVDVTDAKALELAYAAALKSGEPITPTEPDHGGLTLSDTAADIEKMSPDQLSTLSSIGVTTIDVTDKSLTLTVAQAQALYDPIPITVPAGDSVIIVDSESEIEGLTPAEIAQFAKIGVTTIDVSNPGAAPLTVVGGITLSIAGAVPSIETITFTGSGGTLALDDTAGMAGTIYGFSPPDTIDLTDVVYDSVSGSAQLGTDPIDSQQAIVITENDNTYYLDIDPTQNFPTGETFNLAPDASGKGTDLTVSEPPILYPTVNVDGGETVDGAVIDTGGAVEVEGGTVNRAVVQSGGELLGSSGVINDTVIDSGGLLDLVSAAVGTGTIGFGPVVDGAGAELEIDDSNPSALVATLTGFAVGDTIDLTAMSYDSSGSAKLGTGNLLQIKESGGGATLQLDPTQDFLNQTFALSSDGSVGTDLTLVQTPVTTAVTIASGWTVDGAEVGSGGAIEVQAGATLNNAVIDNGGSVDLQNGSSVGNGITIGTEGGTLELHGTGSFGVTVYGFAPSDTIDLADVPYASGGSATLQSGNVLQMAEGGDVYTLQLDPSQVFLTAPTFTLSQDSGTGTDLTVSEPPVTSSTWLSAGQTAAGLVVGIGGTVQVQSGATVNDATVDSGGELVGDYGSTINDTVIESGGLLDLASSGAATGTIGFGPVENNVGGTLQIDDFDPELTATIHGFTVGDVIDLTNVSYDTNGSSDGSGAEIGSDPNNNVPAIAITEYGNTYYLDVDPSQNFSGEYFYLGQDSSGTGTDITVSTAPCYCPGTLILTDSGEVPVQDLKIDDQMMTMSGQLRPIKWIGRRSYGGRFLLGQKHILPVCIKAGALDENTPQRDLWISPHHAMYLEGVLIEARDLVNGVSIVQPDDTDAVEYFHIELDTHDVIIAEGSLSETFIGDDSRGMFHNAHEYPVLYPEEQQAPVRYYAPRCDSGYEVEAARQRIEGRAGLRPANNRNEQFTLRGHVDVVGPDAIEGWARNVEYPEAPVCLDIFVNDRIIGQTLANRYREDLERAGLGSGRHSFEFTPPAGLHFTPDEVEVRRSLDGAAIHKTSSRQTETASLRRIASRQADCRDALSKGEGTPAGATRDPRAVGRTQYCYLWACDGGSLSWSMAS